LRNAGLFLGGAFVPWSNFGSNQSEARLGPRDSAGTLELIVATSRVQNGTKTTGHGVPVLVIWLLCAVIAAVAFAVFSSGSQMASVVKGMAFYSIGLVGFVGGITHMIIRNARRKRETERNDL
jgi:hypothetical protein